MSESKEEDQHRYSYNAGSIYNCPGFTNGHHNVLLIPHAVVLADGHLEDHSLVGEEIEGQGTGFCCVGTCGDRIGHVVQNFLKLKFDPDVVRLHLVLAAEDKEIISVCRYPKKQFSCIEK